MVKVLKLNYLEEGIKVDVYCVMKFGVSIPNVAQGIQDNIRQALLDMTALEAEEINIHVVGIQFENANPELRIRRRNVRNKIPRTICLWYFFIR